MDQEQKIAYLRIKFDKLKLDLCGTLELHARHPQVHEALEHLTKAEGIFTAIVSLQHPEKKL